MRLSQIQLFLWVFPTVVESVTVMAILQRKLWSNLPICLSYLIFLFSERNNGVIKELFDNAFDQRMWCTSFNAAQDVHITTLFRPACVNTENLG